MDELPNRDGADDLEHGLIGNGQLFPANENMAVSVQLGMDALDHSATGSVGVGRRCAAILDAIADMSDKIVGGLTRAIVIVALVQAQVLGLRRSGLERGIMMALSVCRSLKSIVRSASSPRHARPRTPPDPCRSRISPPPKPVSGIFHKRSTLGMCAQNPLTSRVAERPSHIHTTAAPGPTGSTS